MTAHAEGKPHRASGGKSGSGTAPWHVPVMRERTWGREGRGNPSARQSRPPALPSRGYATRRVQAQSDISDTLAPTVRPPGCCSRSPASSSWRAASGPPGPDWSIHCRASQNATGYATTTAPASRTRRSQARTVTTGSIDLTVNVTRRHDNDLRPHDRERFDLHRATSPDPARSSRISRSGSVSYPRGGVIRWKAIANRLGSTSTALMWANGISDPTRILPAGQTSASRRPGRCFTASKIPTHWTASRAPIR